MIDWQTIVVALIVLTAVAYVIRRGWSRLRSFRAAGGSDPSCASGCGSCGGEQNTMTSTPAKVLVQINRSSAASRHTTR